jgi:hypothetical protein
MCWFDSSPMYLSRGACQYQYQWQLKSVERSVAKVEPVLPAAFPSQSGAVSGPRRASLNRGASVLDSQMFDEED